MQVEQAYSNIVTMLEDLLDFHPDFAEIPNDNDKSVIYSYYFFGRPVDVQDVQIYRKSLLESNPGIHNDTELALRRLFLEVNIASDLSRAED